jgi:hypothetical protein
MIRLGLLGMRRLEMARLRIGDLSQLPDLKWMGKRRKVRRATAGPALVALIR